MDGAKLILVEGIPGAGKSSTCQFLRRRLNAAGREVVWWHEEQKRHPIYVFTDGDSLNATMRDLASGDHTRVIVSALERWRQFVEVAASGECIVLVDSCLYGYLTWTLFGLAVAEDEICHYVAATEETVHALDPRLIYLRQDDVAVTLGRATTTRAGSHRELYIRQVERSPYGIRHGFAGFDGLVAYWEAYRGFVDRLFERSTLSKLRLDGANAWADRHRRMETFLDLPAGRDATVDLTPFAGVYGETTIRLEGDSLYAYDLPDRWHRLRLVPLGGDVFDVESLPHRVTFRRDETGAVVGLHVQGVEMLITPAVDRSLTRTDMRTTS